MSSQDQVLRIARFLRDPVVGYPSAAGIAQRKDVDLVRILLDRSLDARQHLLGKRRVDQTLKDALLYPRAEIEQYVRQPLPAAVVGDVVTTGPAISSCRDGVRAAQSFGTAQHGDTESTEVSVS
ncbi:MAG TPA: hypothetical protein VLC46_12940 [Thermoanaerobaculia bacterium]|nr:hypothetical protein [Thermoanaerobaculia bacterium]